MTYKQFIAHKPQRKNKVSTFAKIILTHNFTYVISSFTVVFLETFIFFYKLCPSILNNTSTRLRLEEINLNEYLAYTLNSTRDAQINAEIFHIYVQYLLLQFTDPPDFVTRSKLESKLVRIRSFKLNTSNCYSTSNFT